LDKAVAWIHVQLANPYPAAPRHNRHGSADSQLPELRDNLYTNAGHMWAFLAKTAYESQTAPWARIEKESRASLAANERQLLADCGPTK
jgi:hypothetical protein